MCVSMQLGHFLLFGKKRVIVIEKIEKNKQFYHCEGLQTFCEWMLWFSVKWQLNSYYCSECKHFSNKHKNFSLGGSAKVLQMNTKLFRELNPSVNKCKRFVNECKVPKGDAIFVWENAKFPVRNCEYKTFTNKHKILAPKSKALWGTCKWTVKFLQANKSFASECKHFRMDTSLLEKI